MNDSSARQAAAVAAAEQSLRGDVDAPYAREPGSVTGLVSDLWRQSTALLLEEVELAKTELAEKTTHVAVSGGAVAIGGAVLLAGFIVLLLAAVNALSPLLPPDIAGWLSPAIVGLVVIVIGFVMVSGGIKALEISRLAPRRTMASLRRDTDMVKEHV